ncbi:MAG: hypothetical protein F6K28_48095 [Microcoleus sp. SIO2G3]|nr:hypothetical protein [Microcoleus sp. SIO2G3]
MKLPLRRLLSARLESPIEIEQPTFRRCDRLKEDGALRHPLGIIENNINNPSV